MVVRCQSKSRLQTKFCFSIVFLLTDVSPDLDHEFDLGSYGSLIPPHNNQPRLLEKHACGTISAK